MFSKRWVKSSTDGNERLFNEALYSHNLNSASTVLSTSLGKTFFVWRFILNENTLF